MTCRLIATPLLALLAMTAPTFAVLAGEPDDPELLALLSLLEEQTTVATQTRMNADFVPGMVSVLHADELRGQGLRTVAEALDQVAGFYITADNIGDTRAIVRGAGATLNASNLKILVDGIAVNRPTDGSADWALRMPLSQVDRVEVIRGPGSALYGEFAFAGVVNVVTRRGTGSGLRLGSNSLAQGAGRYQLDFGGGARAQLNVSAWQRSDSGISTGPDNFAADGHGYAPGRIFDNEQGRIALASLDYHGYRVQLQHAVAERGGWYGRTAVMPRDLDPRIEKVTGVQVDKRWEIDDTLSLQAMLGSLQSDLEKATHLPIPAGIDPPGPAPVLLDDNFRRSGSSDSTQRARLSLHWRGLDAHTVYAGLGYAHSRVDSAFTTHQRAGLPPEMLPPRQAPVLPGSERTLASLTLQDQWQLGRSLELTLGLRHDHYDDWGAHTSPRIAAVWRAGDHHIFKAQYAEAFRPPTLEESYPGPETFPGVLLTSDLDEERIRSLEATYIHRRADYRLRLTLFRTEIRDLIEFFINPGDPPLWRNRGDIDTQGAELEWEQTVGRSWRWFANLSFVDAEDHLDVDERLLGAVDWLANLGVVWRRDDRTSHALRIRYVGEQEGWELRTRIPSAPRFDDYATLDYAFALERAGGVDGLKLSAGVRNLGDHAYRSVATPGQFPRGLTHGERTVWLQLEYEL